MADNTEKIKDEKEREKLFKEVYQSKNGRIVLDHIMNNMCKINTSMVNPTDTVNQAFFYAGGQSIGFRIKKILEKEQ